MKYLQRALDLAEARGYLQYPEVLALLDRVPDWFRALGTDAGVAAFEARRGLRVPAAVRELYGCVPLACFLEATIDGEVFLHQLAALSDGEMPPVVEWRAAPHLVFSFHNHSGMVLATRLDAGVDDPLVFSGWGEEEEPMGEEESPPEVFSDLMFRMVDGHEARLDYWQKVYEECQANPAEARRLGGVEWVRAMPGMARRLG